MKKTGEEQGDMRIGIPVPSRSVALAVEYLTWTVQKECGTKNGLTALYWHLMAVVVQHAEVKGVESEDQ